MGWGGAEGLRRCHRDHYQRRVTALGCQLRRAGNGLGCRRRRDARGQHRTPEAPRRDSRVAVTASSKSPRASRYVFSQDWSIGQMQRIIIGAIAVLFNFGCVQLSTAAPQSVDVEALAATLAKQLSTLCPPAARDDIAAHAKCAEGLSDATFIPWSHDGLLFGGDQPNLRISKMAIDTFQAEHLATYVSVSLYLHWKAVGQ